MAGESGKRSTVVVVEDDAVLASAAFELIEDCGLVPFACDRGDVAYRYLEDHADEVAALFVDVGLADAIDGVALAITTAADHPRIRVCVTSGQFQGRPPDLPANVRFLPKPWRAPEVMDFLLAG